MPRDTSSAAYQAIQQCGYLPKMRKECWNIVFQYGPLTSNQVYQYLAQKFPKFSQSALSPWKRLRELEQMGILQSLGEVLDPLTNRQVTLWDVIQNKAPVKLLIKVTRSTVLKQIVDLFEVILKHRNPNLDHIASSMLSTLETLRTNLQPFVTVKKVKPHQYQAVSLTPTQQECYDTLKSNGPQTSNDLFSLILLKNPNRDKITLSPWKICSQLRDMGVIYEAGVRTNSVTEMENIVWDVTTKDINTLEYVAPYSLNEATTIIYDLLVELIYAVKTNSHLDAESTYVRMQQALIAVDQ